jgi:hypothetical protein
MPRAKKAKATEIRIEAPNMTLLQVIIAGITPLIVNRFSEKSQQEIEDKRTGKGTQAKKIIKPKEQYENSMYRGAGEGAKRSHQFPSICFKKAMVTTLPLMEQKVFKTQGQMMFYVYGEKRGQDMVTLRKAKPHMRTDWVRLKSGGADMRYRAEYPTWEATLTVEFNTNKMTTEQVVALLATAGHYNGIGEWRPQKSGNIYGRFEVLSAEVIG